MKGIMWKSISVYRIWHHWDAQFSWSKWLLCYLSFLSLFEQKWYFFPTLQRISVIFSQYLPPYLLSTKSAESVCALHLGTDADLHYALTEGHLLGERVRQFLKFLCGPSSWKLYLATGHWKVAETPMCVAMSCQRLLGMIQCSAQRTCVC